MNPRCIRLLWLQVQHVYLLQFPPEPRPMGQAWLDLLLQGSGKLALLDRMLERLKAGGHRVLIYSQFVLLLARRLLLRC